MDKPRIFLGSSTKQAKLLEALRAHDARIVELSGHAVRVYEGDPTNIKITTPLDLWIAEAIVRGRGSGTGS